MVTKSVNQVKTSVKIKNLVFKYILAKSSLIYLQNPLKSNKNFASGHQMIKC